MMVLKWTAARLPTMIRVDTKTVGSAIFEEVLKLELQIERSCFGKRGIMG